MLTAPTRLVTNGDMAGDITSSVQQLDNAFGYSVQAVYTGSSIAGVISLEASVNHRQDDQGNVSVAGDWVAVLNSAQTLSAAGSYIWNIADSMYPYFRVKYAHHADDSGVLNVWSFVRGF